jgi:hypothetical protein
VDRRRSAGRGLDRGATVLKAVTVELPATTTEYLHIPVTLPSGVTTGSTPVRIAVVPHRNNPAGSEWQAADWADGAARVLVGPDSGLALTTGDYWVWINIDPPGAENVVRKAGILSVT